MKKYRIKEDILNLIYCGTYAPGEKLPSIRSVAESYGCSITPVVEAYNDLAATHIIESRPCSGYYVSEDYEEHPRLLQHQQIDTYEIEHYDLLDNVAKGYAENVVFVEDNIEFPFGTTAACIDFYPVRGFFRELATATRRALARGENYQIRIHDVAELKHEIMKWMGDAAKAVNISELTIFQSVSASILVALRTCADPGDLIAMETPGFIGSFFITEFLNMKTLNIPSDPMIGLDVDYFEKYLKEGKRPSCLFCSSAYVNPSGACMPEENKQRLVKICAEYGIPIVEDDIGGYISFESHRPLPLKCYDPENVIYISGFGKALSPEMRTAWIAPGKYANRLALRKHQLVSYATLTVQYAMAAFLKSGQASASFRSFKRELQRVMKEQAAIINECFPLERELTCPKGGIYLWVPLAKEIDTEVLAKKCAAHGLTIAPAVTFHAPENMRNYCRINSVAVPWDDKAKNALRLLGKITKDYYELFRAKKGRQKAQ